MSELATSELINRVRRIAPAERVKLPAEELFQIETTLAAYVYGKVDRLCRREEASFDCGPLLWLTQFTKTENPQYEQMGLPFLAPFPRKEYFKYLFAAFLQVSSRHPLAVPKSRTMMTSFSAAGFAAWAAQWKKEETVIQTLNVDKAMHLIDYVRQLVEHQDPWISQLHPIEKRTAFAISWKGGGEVAAIPSGADAIRAYHPTWYFQDESAYMPEGEAALNAVLPTGAKIIMVSTAAPGWFGDMCSM